MSEKNSFDLSPAINWYHENQEKLLVQITKHVLPCHIPFEYSENMGSGKMYLTQSEIKSLIGLFPRPAIGRSVLGRIEVDAPAWYGPTPESRKFFSGELKTTYKQTEAVSPISIVLSDIYSYPGLSWCDYKIAIKLHSLRCQTVIPAVGKIIQAYSIVRGVARSIVGPELSPGHHIRLINDEVVDSAVYLWKIPELANGLPSISFRSADFMDEKNKLLDTTQAIHEVAVETITAMLLGFAYQPNGEGLNPTQNHHELAKYMFQYLYAVIT